MRSIKRVGLILKTSILILPATITRVITITIGFSVARKLTNGVGDIVIVVNDVRDKVHLKAQRADILKPRVQPWVKLPISLFEACKADI